MNAFWHHKPTLFKKRMFYTKLYILAVLPLILFAVPMWPEYSLPHELMELVGHICVIAGILIRVISSLYVGGRKNDVLVTDGPFSVVRNPLYVGSFIATIGLGFATGSMTILVALIACFMLCYFFTVGKEEAYLTAKFGEFYREYQARVPRWVPNLALWHNPAELTIRPRFVLLTARDALMFFAALMLIEALCELHVTGQFPSLLTLP